MAEDALIHKGVCDLGGFAPAEGIRFYDPADIVAHGGNPAWRIGKAGLVRAFNLVPVGQGDTGGIVKTASDIKELKSYLYMGYTESFSFVDAGIGSYSIANPYATLYYSGFVDNVVAGIGGILQYNAGGSMNVDVYEYPGNWVTVLSGIATTYYDGSSGWGGQSGWGATISLTNLAHRWSAKKIGGIRFYSVGQSIKTAWFQSDVTVLARVQNKKI